MTTTPAFPAPVQVSTLSPGDTFLWWDPNNTDNGIHEYTLTNQGGGSYVRQDGAVGTLSSEVYVVKVSGSFVIGG